MLSGLLRRVEARVLLLSAALLTFGCVGAGIIPLPSDWWPQSLDSGVAHGLEAGALCFGTCLFGLCAAALFDMFGRLGSSVRGVLSSTLLVLALPCIALAWYNAMQDDQYLVDCFQSTKIKTCSRPRYKYHDIIYEFVYREPCMMGRMHHPGSFAGKEKLCYEEFSERWPRFLWSVAQCGAAAVVIGLLLVMDSTAVKTVGGAMDETTIINQARVDEAVRGGPLTDRRAYAAALTDE
eukprot:TRINITY_DN65052_c0_g1_i1.p1 TRINITY_DN65052_c0_g1~~TRINITY_DN65052_c0_g1_i1.p1  ORF type:complete len:237 (+),score=41.93 TRINITY_DN65052_c0_g1_i1:121-831(+)